MKKLIILSSIFISSFSIQAQSGNDYWKSVSENKITVTGKRDIVPNKYKTFNLDLNSLKSILSDAPLDKNTSVTNSSVIVSLPMPDGTIQKFKVVESPVMDQVLQAEFPNIRTYSIHGIDDAYASGKLDVNEFGFHGMVFTLEGTVFIDPYCKWNTEDYISYYSHDFEKPMADRLPEVGVLTDNHTNSPDKSLSPNALCAGLNLKTYRLAVACTKEYAIAATGSATPTKAQTLAKVVTSVNRVDGVYEKEVAVRMVLVSTTTLVLYTSATGSGFTTADNSNAGTLIGKSHTVITSNIGTANFDIGHTFSTGGGGLAQLGCVCNSSNKGQGITGSPSPVGDPYDIDYVAHEVGHQFSGNHTFNGSAGNCSGGNRNPTTAAEPGSGVTIMAYAGICDAHNIANNSIAYFHAVSYDEIMNFVTNNGGNNCDVATLSGNNPPSVIGSVNYVVPKSTPFSLTGSATDIDGDALTYQWEEVDLGASAGNWNSGNKPFFRSFIPVASPTRLFPKLSIVLAGTYTTAATLGEYLPTTSQTLKFRLTARDNKMGGGGVCSATTQVTVDGASGPFAVTSQSTTGISYPSGSTQVITWNVNGTNAAPVNCANVNIYISNNAGNTFTLVLANTPNDGNENVIMPNLATTSTICRVRVESIGNVFFDINKKNFTITAMTTGINQYASNGFNVLLYPNPFTSSVKIDINASHSLDGDKTVLNVYDILGNLVRTEPIKITENFTKTYDFSNLANGSYIVVVTDGKQKSVTRLIKM